ncbi:MAG: ATP-binding protein [Candidatus Cryptobacteroides sp.]
MQGNPFILEPYKSKELFCDREQETRQIIDYLNNGRNITLISPRRLGKTGLIFRVFEEIRESFDDIETFYVDISSSQGIDDFIKLLSEAVVTVMNRQNKLSAFFKAIGGIRPLITYDAVTGTPELSMTFRNDNEKSLTLKAILQYLENHDKRVVLAIDEFQQIREYQGVNMEALLRTYIQPLHNVRFIFCGSKKHTMTDMFSNAKKPFYESTTFVPLGKLDIETYKTFIIKLFREGGKSIGPEETEQMIEWTRDHTFYTQTLCNEVFYRSSESVSETDILEAESAILAANRDRFLELQRLLTNAQWKLLSAMAKEGHIEHPTAASFIQKYRLGSGASVSKNIKSLIDKELILVENTSRGSRYFVYNVFLSRYLERC